MVKLICFLKRKPGLTPDEFHAHWRDVHGPLIGRTRSGSHVLRYEQHHRPAGDGGRWGDPDYDGVTIQWFESVEAFEASVREDDYAEIAADMERFLDSGQLVWLITEEPEVVFDRTAGAA